MRGLFNGLLSYAGVPAASFKYGLWPYYILAGVISTVLGVSLVYGSLSFGDDFGVWLGSFIPWDGGASIIEKTSSWIGRLVTLTLSLMLYKYIVLIIVSPIMSPLSERIESRVYGEGQKGSFSIVSFSKEIIRGIRISLRNLSRELFFTILLLIASFIPGFALFTAPLIFLVQAYYAGFGNMDYYLERHYKVKGAVQYVRENRGIAIGNGSIFLLILMIPFVGFLFAPGVSTTAATLAILKTEMQ